jgi:hypothetical protein
MATVLCALGCGEGGGESNAVHGMQLRLQQCGLLTSGRLPSTDFVEALSPGVRAEVTCLAQCLAALPCSDLVAVLCEGISVAAVGWCTDKCLPTMKCDDGEEIPERYRCDGDDDCSAAEDEVGCEQFECPGGGSTPVATVCDGDEDCSDGADELGCPDAFSCGAGTPEVIPSGRRCDGAADCDDGSDEVDCPEPAAFACANGERIAAEASCDLTLDCEDGSDERGCATLTCEPPGWL